MWAPYSESRDDVLLNVIRNTTFSFLPWSLSVMMFLKICYLALFPLGSCQALVPPASRPILSRPEDRQAMAVLSTFLKPWISAYCTIRLHLLNKKLKTNFLKFQDGDCRALIPKHVVLPGWEPQWLSWSLVHILWPCMCSLKISRAM